MTTAKNEGRALILTQKGNYKVLLGYHSSYPSTYHSDIEVPKGWDASVALEEECKRVFVDNYFKDGKRKQELFEISECGFAPPQARGKKLTGRFVRKHAEWLRDNKGMKGYYFFISGVYGL